MTDMINTTIKGIGLKLKTHSGVFSPSRIDAGTLAMLSLIDFDADDKILDLGCGYGVVGILAAKLIGEQNVVMIDNDPLAVKIAQENAVLNEVSGIAIYQSDGMNQMSETGFTKIVSNPPYHTDFSIPKNFIEKGFNRLVVGGTMHMVTKRKAWYQNKLRAIFGGVRVREIDGYYVFCAEKRSSNYAKKRPKQS